MTTSVFTILARETGDIPVVIDFTVWPDGKSWTFESMRRTGKRGGEVVGLLASDVGTVGDAIDRRLALGRARDVEVQPKLAAPQEVDE